MKLSGSRYNRPMDTTTPKGKFRAFVDALEAKALPLTAAGLVVGGACVSDVDGLALSQNQLSDLGQTAAFVAVSTATSAPAENQMIPDPMGDGPGYQFTRPEEQRSGELLTKANSSHLFRRFDLSTFTT